MNNKKSKNFQELIVWQKSHQLVLTIYKITKQFPIDEKYGLTSQMRRAAISIPANIAEGYRKRGKLDKVRFLNIAQGSLEEVRYYMILSRDLEYYTFMEETNQLEEVSKLLESYLQAILKSQKM